MQLIRPTCIDDSNLSSSNVPVSTAPEWDGITAYVPPDVVKIDAATENATREYECIIGNTNVYPPDDIDEPIPKWLDLGVTNRWQMFDDVVGTATKNTQGTQSGAKTNATGYAIGETVINLAAIGTGTIKIADVIKFNGDDDEYIITVGDDDVSNGGSIEIEAPGLLVAIPAAETPIETVGSSIKVVITPGAVNSIGLLNLVATRFKIVVQNGVGGEVVYDTEVALNLAVSTDWYEYFYEEIQIRTSAVFTDLPAYVDAVITVTIIGPNTVECGLFIVGRFTVLGEAQWGLGAGIISYSQKETNKFGGYTVIPGAFAKRMNAKVYVNNGKVDKTQRTMVEYLDIPVLWVGDPKYEISIVYGPYKDFDTLLQGPEGSWLTLTIEGLV